MEQKQEAMPIQGRLMEESCFVQLVAEGGAWANLINLADDLLMETELKMERKQQKDSSED